MPAKMKKIETYLKKLAEKRARAAGDVERAGYRYPVYRRVLAKT